MRTLTITLLTTCCVSILLLIYNGGPLLAQEAQSEGVAENVPVTSMERLRSENEALKKELEDLRKMLNELKRQKANEKSAGKAEEAQSLVEQIAIEMEHAENTLERAIELAPDQSRGYRDLAHLYLRTSRDLGRAKTLAEKAVELEPSAANYNVLGWALFTNGEMDDSLAAMRRAIELDPNNAEYKHRYVQIEQLLR